jgi:hypothetical protein
LTVLRRIGAVIAGLIVAWCFVAGAEFFVHRLYPPPPGTNMEDFAQVKKFVASLPATAYVLVLAGWLVATFVGTLVAAKIGRTRVSAYIVGGILLCAGIANAIMIPQPIWFSIVSFAIYIGMTILGARAGAPARA